jgi:hypothetical protein
MSSKPKRPRFRVGDRVRVQFGPTIQPAVILEDRGNIGAGGRRLFGVRVELDPPNFMYLELPEKEILPEK